MLRWLLVLCLSLACAAPVQAEQTVKVLTFNIWGGKGGGVERARQIAAVLKAADADIIGLQEAEGPPTACASESCVEAEGSLACRLAWMIAFHCHDQARGEGEHGANALLSRYPIASTGPERRGLRVETPGRAVTVFNLHLPDAPYQPYQLAGIPYGDAPDLTTAEAAIAAAEATRGAAMRRLEREVAAVREGPILIIGDFNEPSPRDWTPRAAALGLVPLPVAWPTVRRIEAMGFVDAWRVAHPDEIDRPGHSWTVLPAARECHDRIDFIFARGTGLEVTGAWVVGERSLASDIVVAPWPSDHRAVLAIVRLGGEDRVAQAER